MNIVINDTVINADYIVQVRSANHHLEIHLLNKWVSTPHLPSDIEENIGKMFILYGGILGRKTIFFNTRDMTDFMMELLDFESENRLYEECRQPYRDFWYKNRHSFKDCYNMIDFIVNVTINKNKNMDWHEAFCKTFDL